MATKNWHSWALGSLLALGLTGCSGQQVTQAYTGPLILPDSSGEIALKQWRTHDTLPEDRPKIVRVDGDGRIFRVSLYGGSQVQFETGMRAFVVVEGHHAGPWVEWPRRWGELLDTWKNHDRVVGHEEICLLGGKVGQRRLAGGLCFNTLTSTWRALGGESVWFSADAPLTSDHWTCNQWSYSQDGALFRCTLSWEPGETDDSGRPVPKPGERYVLVQGIR